MVWFVLPQRRVPVQLHARRALVLPKIHAAHGQLQYAGAAPKTAETPPAHKRAVRRKGLPLPVPSTRKRQNAAAGVRAASSGAVDA